MEYLDLHTHRPHSQAVLNVIIGKDAIPERGYFTAGIHPWYLNGADWNELRKAVSEPNCVAVGECGLDKLSPTDFDIQLDIFKRQIELADEVAKPLIIHCVKAHNELLAIKNKVLTKVPWIIHGFNQNEAIGKKLLTKGFYFSLGKALTVSDSNASRFLTSIPLDRLFLETDDAKIEIAMIYASAATRLGLPVPELVANLRQNFQTVFPCL